jgi:hypothetical protein
VSDIHLFISERAISEKQAKRSQLLWNACQSLISTLKSGTNTKSWAEQLKPLEHQVDAISKAAGKENAMETGGGFANCIIAQLIPS